TRRCGWASRSSASRRSCGGRPARRSCRYPRDVRRGPTAPWPRPWPTSATPSSTPTRCSTPIDAPPCPQLLAAPCGPPDHGSPMTEFLPRLPHHETPCSRRDFLTRAGGGLGLLALLSLLEREGRAAPGTDAPGSPTGNPLTPRAPHFRPTAKSVIWCFLDG